MPQPTEAMKQTVPDERKMLGDLLTPRDLDDLVTKYARCAVQQLLRQMEEGRELRTQQIDLAMMRLVPLIDAESARLVEAAKAKFAWAGGQKTPEMAAEASKAERMAQQRAIEARMKIKPVADWLRSVKDDLEAADGKSPMSRLTQN